MKRTTETLALLAAILLPGMHVGALPGSAQMADSSQVADSATSETPGSLRVGERVRFSTALSGLHEGTLVSVRSDSLTIESPSGSEFRTVALLDVIEMETWATTDRRKLMGGVGLTLGLVGGWLWGAEIAARGRKCDEEPDTGEEVVVCGFFAGAAFESFGAGLITIGVASATGLGGYFLGRQLGKGMKVEAWVPADLTRLDLMAGPDGRVGLAVQLRW